MEHPYNSTHRFSNRADQYQRYRPQYPESLLTYLESHIGLTKNSTIAEIGSGTGIFTKLFLDKGYSVNAVEPNDPMRMAAEVSLKHYPGFTSIAATAEQTTLADHSVDLITVAQAFHWFRPAETKAEFQRILRSGGHIALVWNILKDDTPFLKGYAQLKATYENGIQHTHRANLTRIQEIFAPEPVTYMEFPNAHILDREGFHGFFKSFSTVPLETDDRYQAMMKSLDSLFDTYQKDGKVSLDYQTKLYLI